MTDNSHERDPRVSRNCADCDWYGMQLAKGDSDQVTADIAALFERHLRSGSHTPKTARSVRPCGR